MFATRKINFGWKIIIFRGHFASPSWEVDLYLLCFLLVTANEQRAIDLFSSMLVYLVISDSWKCEKSIVTPSFVSLPSFRRFQPSFLDGGVGRLAAAVATSLIDLG